MNIQILIIRIKNIVTKDMIVRTFVKFFKKSQVIFTRQIIDIINDTSSKMIVKIPNVLNDVKDKQLYSLLLVLSSFI